MCCYFNETTKKHKEFFHYTSLKAIDAILKNNTIRISSTDRFNDRKDSSQFGDLLEQKKHYAICFSSGSNENLSLWYLYSGVDGKGGRIGLTYSKLMRMIEEGKFYLAEYDYDISEVIGPKILLDFHKDIEVMFRDVLYSACIRNGTYVDLKYNTMTNHGNMSNLEYEKFVSGNKGFNKRLIWYYEKESRLLIKLMGTISEIIDSNKNYAILWELPQNLIKHIKIMCAPEIESASEIYDYSYLKRFIVDTSRVYLSEHAGDIEMNILQKCEKEICANCNHKKREE